MYGEEIEYYLHDTPCFLGTFARDCLPTEVKTGPACIIGNTDKKGEEGAHWVAMHLRSNGTGYYFDSLGNAPLHEEFVRFLNDRCPRGWFYNTCVLQGLLSETCGLYCIHFVRCASNEISDDQFFQILSTDRKLNDRRIAQLYERPDLEVNDSLE